MDETELTIIANQALGEISDLLSLEASEHIISVEPCALGGSARVLFQAASAYGRNILQDSLPRQVSYVTARGEVPVYIDVFCPLEVH